MQHVRLLDWEFVHDFLQQRLCYLIYGGQMRKVHDRVQKGILAKQESVSESEEAADRSLRMTWWWYTLQHHVSYPVLLSGRQRILVRQKLCHRQAVSEVTACSPAIPHSDSS